MPDNILIFRNGSIGNTLVAVPALRALRKRFPNARISIILDQPGMELLAACPYLTNRILYDKRSRHRGLAAHLQFISSLRRERFDLALIYKRFFRNELLAFLAGVPERYGYLTPGVRPFLLSRTVPYIEDKPIAELNLDLVRLLGIEDSDAHLEMWASETDRARVDSLFSSLPLHSGRPRIIFHLGGDTVGKVKWPAARYAEVMNALIKEGKSDLLVIAGPGEAGVIKELLSYLPEAPPVIGDLSLPQLAETIRRCDLFVGNDSGPLHLAEAVGLPAVIVYPPLPQLNRHLIKWKPPGDNYLAVTPAPTTLADKKFPLSPEEIAACHRSIPAEQVLAGIFSLLHR